MSVVCIAIQLGDFSTFRTNTTSIFSLQNASRDFLLGFFSVLRSSVTSVRTANQKLYLLTA
jgi:hypothetical protein